MTSSPPSQPARRPRLAVPVIWGNVPQRNRHFTGREDLLRRLRAQITDRSTTALLPHALRGFGGVGKTQLAIEYIYRHAADYDVVWWIPADQPGLMRSSLAALAPRLGMTDIPVGRVEDAVDAVRDALRRGEPYSRWLLVFDNADQPEHVRDLIPYGPGHTLVTSRNHRWESAGASLEVNVFERGESLEFLGKRVPGTSAEESDRLAERLGDLPLALEQAGAYMSETATPVGVYLRLLEEEAGKILAENQPSDYPVPVAAAWSMSVARLRESMPQAMELLHRCAFFGYNPIPLELLERGRFALDPSPLRDMLRDPYELGRAIREIGRYSLARIDNHRRTLQMHRIIQTLIREDLTEERSDRVRDEVHRLLAAADPGIPDDVDNWPKYADLLGHATGISKSTAPEVCALVLNLIRYLIVSGDHAAARDAVETAKGRWKETTSPDELIMLILYRHEAQLLLEIGDTEGAHTISVDLLPRMREALGSDHPETLRLMSLYGGILHERGDYQAALELNEEALPLHHRIFGLDHPFSFNIVNNLVRSYAHQDRYDDAIRLAEEVYQQARDYYGRDDHPRTVFALNAVSWTLRLAGRYAEALERVEQAWGLYQEIIRQRVLGDRHREVLINARNRAIIHRKAGDLEGGLELAQDAYDRYMDAVGPEHPYTIAALITLANARRATGRYDGTDVQFERATAGYGRRLGEDHPYALASPLNLAVLHRGRGDPAAARDLLEKACGGLVRSVGERHHYTFIARINLASALADLGDAAAARDIGEETLDGLRTALGPDHPHALICALNLSLDLAAVGAKERAERLYADSLERQRRTLGMDHPDCRQAADRERLNLDFQP